MATYTDAENNFDKYFAEATFELGSGKIQPGLEPNAVLSNPRTVGCTYTELHCHSSRLCFIMLPACVVFYMSPFPHAGFLSFFNLGLKYCCNFVSCFPILRHPLEERDFDRHMGPVPAVRPAVLGCDGPVLAAALASGTLHSFIYYFP